LGQVEGAQTTNVFDGERAIEALGLRARRVVAGPWDELPEALERGAGVVLCIAYGVVNDLTPWRSGDRRFRGGHAIYLQELGRGRTDRRRRTLSFDSLYDGRRPTIPDGPRWMRLSVLHRAAEAFAGQPSRWWGLIVPLARDTAGPGDALHDAEHPGVTPPLAMPDEGVPLPHGSLGELLEPAGLVTWCPEDDPEVPWPDDAPPLPPDPSLPS
jgi:hypothetical protein